MRRIALLAVSLVALTAASCEESGTPTSPAVIGTSRAGGSGDTGGSTPPTPTPPTGGTAIICSADRGTMSAQIDGATWTAICVQAASWTANVLSIDATNATQKIILGAITVGPATIDLLTGPAVASVTLLSNSATWTTANSAGTGTLALSRLDLQGASGTFSFSAPAAPGTPATGTKVVAGGVFNVIF